MSQIKDLIKENKITEQFFNSLQIYNESWLQASIEADQQSEPGKFDLKVAFKSRTQNDTSIFYKPPLSRKWTQAGIKKMLKSLETECPAAVVEAIRREGLIEELDMSYLDDVNVHIYDEDQAEEVRMLAYQTGVTVLDELVPFETTHVICKQQTY